MTEHPRSQRHPGLRIVLLSLALLGGAAGLCTAVEPQAGMPHVEWADGLVSIDATEVSLGAVLGALDAVGGTRSTVPPELADRPVNVSLREMALDRAIHKVFEGLALDYAVIGESQIVVLGQSEALAPRSGRSPSTLSSPQSDRQSERRDPFREVERERADDGGLPAVFGQSGRENPGPGTIVTPFGVLGTLGGTGSTVSPPLPGASRAQPFQSIFDLAPGILDANRPPQPPGPVSPPPGMPSGPPAATP